MRWWDRPPGEGFAHLAEEEADFVRVLAGAAFPAGDVIDLSGEDADLDRFFDAMLAGMPALTGNLLKLLIEALQHAPVPVRGSRFTALSAETQQAQVVDWLASSRAEIRSGVQSLVVLLAMGYTTHPDVAPLMSTWHGCGYGR